MVGALEIISQISLSLLVYIIRYCTYRASNLSYNVACFVWVRNLVCHIKGKTMAEGFREWGTKDDVWAKKGVRDFMKCNIE